MKRSRSRSILYCIFAAELLCLLYCHQPLTALASEVAVPADVIESAEVVEHAAGNIEDTPEIAAEDGAVEKTVMVEETVGSDSSSAAEASEPDGSGEARMTRIELNSGAQRSADFVSADVSFTTSDGTFELVMGGLKEENRTALVEALEEHYVVGWHVPLTFVDEAFPDAENPAVFEASIGSLKEGLIHASSHSVTVAGVIVDRTAKELADRFKAIAIIDSDNDSVPSEAMGKGSRLR